MSHKSIASIAIAALLVAGPAFAQSNTNAPSSNTMTHTNSNSAANTPSERNPILDDNGDARASKVIGSSVYNDQNTKVGSIDDILIGKDDKLQAVVSVGGFLGMDSKYIEVPYSQLKFGDAHANSDNRVMLPGATKNSLMSMTSFNYTRS